MFCSTSSFSKRENLWKYYSILQPFNRSKVNSNQIWFNIISLKYSLIFLNSDAYFGYMDCKVIMKYTIENRLDFVFDQHHMVNKLWDFNQCVIITINIGFSIFNGIWFLTFDYYNKILEWKRVEKIWAFVVNWKY